MNTGFIWWIKNKDKLGLVPALVFWIVSILCFVFGLAFENPTGISIGGMDLSLVIAFSLGLANTIIQIVGNDSSKDDMGTVMWLGWIASYMFGIGSNVNFLYTTINLSVPVLKILVCVGLGAMIEIMPERLFVTFLKSLTFTTTKLNRQENPQQREERHNGMRRNSKDTGNYELRESKYPPVGMSPIPKAKANIPPFLMNRGK